MFIRSFLILILATSSLFAQGGMFGFHPSPCPEGGTPDSNNKQCLYCPQGTELVTEPSSKAREPSLKTKWCSGIALLGNSCPIGEDAWFDDRKNLCIYCFSGYSFSPDHKECYK